MTSKILKYSPQFIRSRIENRPGLLKILDNISWLFFDKILRMGVGLLVGVWVARYLGPEQFGLLNFAMAFVGLFGAIATLGLQGIMVRDIVRKPEESNIILGTGFLLRIVGGLITFCLVLIVISYLRPDDTLTKAIVAIFGFMQIIKASEVVKYWFESQVQSKFVVWVENSVFLVIAGVKVTMILMNFPLLAFVWAAFAEALLVAVLLFTVYGWKIGSLASWKPDFARGRTLLRDSWPLILSGIAVSLALRIDQVMLEFFMTTKDVGLYAAGVRLSEPFAFIPVVISQSIFPKLLTLNIDKDYIKIKWLIRSVFFILIVLSATVSFLSDSIVLNLFGEQYNGSSTALTILIWTIPITYLNIITSKILLKKDLQKKILNRQLVLAILNIILNIILIPKIGIAGAAISTLLADIVIALFYDYIDSKTRRILYLKYDAIFFTNIFSKDKEA